MIVRDYESRVDADLYYHGFLRYVDEFITIYNQSEKQHRRL